MHWDEIRLCFNRAAERTISVIKLWVAFAVLAACGLIGVFCRGIATHADDWFAMSLTFIPILISGGILLALGIFLIRIYHHEVKNIPVNLGEMLGKSWEVMLTASYFSLPILLSYLVLWMSLGIFLLLREIPGLGTAIGIILAPGPFLLNLGALLLCLFHAVLLFFIAPALALKSADGIKALNVITKRIKHDFFANIVWGIAAILPLAFIGTILTLAASLTESWYFDEGSSAYIALQWFFVMLPYMALMAPGVVFFFQFAAEAHIALQKELRRVED